jgi:alkylation response protein AidB-like acyl-CoA dehydrogenase
MKKPETPVLTTMAKWIASEVHNRTALKGIRIMGGAGIETENPMQRHYRDSTVLLFAPISNEMAKNLVGESMGLPKSY